VDGTVFVDTKRVVDGEPRIMSHLLDILWRGSLCAADPERSARTGLGSIRDVDEDREDPRPYAGEIANA
jgi:hypothetical protein